MKCPKCGSEVKKVTCCGGRISYRCQGCNALLRLIDVERGKLPSQIAKEEKEKDEKETEMVSSRSDSVD